MNLPALFVSNRKTVKASRRRRLIRWYSRAYLPFGVCSSRTPDAPDPGLGMSAARLTLFIWGMGEACSLIETGYVETLYIFLTCTRLFLYAPNSTDIYLFPVPYHCGYVALIPRDLNTPVTSGLSKKYGRNGIILCLSFLNTSRLFFDLISGLFIGLTLGYS